MDRDTFSKLQNAFEHAISLSADSKQQYLLELCQSDPQLHSELIPLLASDEHTHNFIHSAVNATFEDMHKDPHQWIGKTFGAFKVTAEIASGGMGVVFLGERDDGQFEQQVAIKVLNGILASSQMQQAFDNERHIFAQMHHPYIAQLYDGGATSDGIPYLIMEYIEGEPIDEYCENNQLTIKQRLTLFQKVCEAVSYAHRNLIVHSDIKPSNILVTCSGIPKLLDFGIAKAINANTGKQQGDITQIGNRPLTPDFASPEQKNGEAITTSSDIYSLGVLLHYLLSGGMPFKNLDSTDPNQLVELPIAPSQTFKKRKKESKEFSSSDIKKFNALKGDLDAIVLKSLSEESERRYISVEALNEDLTRYLENKPVQAQKSSTIYYLKKYLKRHAASVIVATIFIVTIGISSWFAASQHFKYISHKDAAEELSDFMSEIFYKAGNNRITVKEILKNGAALIKDNTAISNLKKAKFLNEMSESYIKLGEYEIANEFLDEALALHKMANGTTEDKIEILFHLGFLKSTQKKSTQSIAVLREAVDLIEHSHYFGQNMHAYVLDMLAGALSDLGKYDEAIELYFQSLAILEKYPEEARAMVIAKHNLAIILHLNGEYFRALELENQVAKDAVEIFDEKDVIFSAIYNFMGTLIIDTSFNTQKALNFFQKALDFDEAFFGPEHIDVAIDLFSIAKLEVMMGELSSATQKIQRAIKINEEKLGVEAVDVGHNLVLLAQLQILAGQINLAEESLDRADKIYGAYYVNEEHESLAKALSVRAMLYNAQGLTDKSLEYYQKSDDLLSRLFDETHPLSMESSLALALFYIHQNNKNASQEYIQRVQLIDSKIAIPTRIKLKLHEILEAHNQL
ncbi:serine/threonine-protein kinase [uncultured Paraglaciecola sp.]|uniref:serine/threonine-protein kinase n=1 Tax=uncultured Paraglaciecola sp. TaxID=1765024 RepID=UPI0030D9BA21|tara:strand:- start:75336 stop:77906 length:2571 start_codon:yes stop_codon:yes gene_type:complete